MEQLPNEVVEMIFELVDQTTDLLQCRLVNKTWSSFATQALKTRNTIQFKSEVKAEQALSIFKTKLPFLDYPFSKIAVRMRTRALFHDDVQLNSTIPLVSFFRRYGSHIQKLNLEFSDYLTGSEAYPFLYLPVIPLLLGDSPNLQRLKLEFHYALTKDQGIQLGDLLPEVIPKLTSIHLIRIGGYIGESATHDGRNHFILALKNAAPNLRTLQLTLDDYFEFTDFRDTLTMFKDIPEIDLRHSECRLWTTDVPKLKEFLTDPVNLTTPHLELFHKSGTIVNMDQVRSGFWRLLEQQSATLKTLSLIVGGEEITRVQLPVITALESVKIETDYDYPFYAQPFVTFTPQQFPKLKHVDMRDYCGAYSPFGMGVEVFETVESFRVSAWDNGRGVTYPWDLIFPNCKSLDLYVHADDDEFLPFFMEQMSYVTHFKLEFETVKYWKWEPEHQKNLHRRCQILDGSFGMETSHSLSDFKNLETLDVNGGKDGHRLVTKTIVQMTESGSLNPLKRLTLYEADGDMVSEAEKDILRTSHQDVIWTPSRSLLPYLAYLISHLNSSS